MATNKPKSGDSSDKERRSDAMEEKGVLPGDKERAADERKHRKDDGDALVTGTGRSTTQGSQPGARPGGKKEQ